jgi:hypothetical protein
MKMKTSKLLELLLALSIIPMLLIPLTAQVFAVSIPPVTPMSPGGPQNPTVDPILWETGGEAAAATLAWNPEWLKLCTKTQIHSQTTIIVQGQDVYHQNVEAKVVIPAGTDESKYFILNDTHSTPPWPVTFAKITGIFQQNGTHCNAVEILTHNNSLQQYIGRYTTSGLFKAGVGPSPWLSTAQYLVATGPHTYPDWQGGGYLPTPHPTATYQNVPVEPVNPEPLKIVTNWIDNDQDAQIDPGELHGVGAPGAVVWIEGLDENGNPLIVGTTITDTINEVNAGAHTWSTVCKVWGGGNDEYYIFTHPMRERALFKYFIRIDHMNIYPECYDILANPDQVSGAYPGATNITVALVDADNHLVHAPVRIIAGPGPYAEIRNVTVNFMTTGGKIQPSYEVQIPPCHITATVNLTADTNARTIKVTANANVPPCQSDSVQSEPLSLFAWTELTFDGINSVQVSHVVVHTMMWGWETWNWNGTVMFKKGPDPVTGSGPVPPKPPLPEWLGGPWANSSKPPYKLDGPIYEVMIPLYPGCNLISIPVHPYLCNTYFCEAYGGHGIPMELLFGKTSATDTIEAIWWFNESGMWETYIPGVTTGKNFTDGIGYWVKAEKPCTLEISGVEMENAPFTPPEYPVRESWNLMGVTSIRGVLIDDYLQCLSAGNVKLYGAVWVYYSYSGTWIRNPPWGLWPGEAFWVYYKANDVLDNPTIAP